MKLVLATLLAFAAPFAAATASATQEDAATGGGQIVFGTAGGAGSTLAFTAQGTMDAARGQVQYVNREDGGHDVNHGTVKCIAVEGNVARISGTWVDDGDAFGLYVEDNGEGAAADDDVATVLPGEATCEFDEPDNDAKTALSRGNSQVRDRS